MASSPHLKCSVDGDLPPVNLQAEWRKEEHCKDLEGTYLIACQLKQILMFHRIYVYSGGNSEILL